MQTQPNQARRRWQADLRREFRLDPPITIRELGIDLGSSTLGRIRAAEFRARLRGAGLRAMCIGTIPVREGIPSTTICDPDDASQVVVENAR